MLAAIAFGTGVVYLAVKDYRVRRRKLHLALFLQSEKSARPGRDGFWQHQMASRRLMGTRQQQFNAMLTRHDIHDISEADRRLNRVLGIAFASLGFAIAGAWLYPPLALLSVPGYIYASIPLHTSTLHLLREGRVGVDTLMSITSIGAILTGYFVLANINAVFNRLCAKLLSNIQDTSRKNLIDVFRQQPRSAWILVDGIEVETPLERLQASDTVVVRAGDLIPADGTITDGVALIDQRLLTGEAQPVEKEAGDDVFASTVVLAGRVSFQVHQTGASTTAAHIGHILNHTTDFKSTVDLRAETLADRTVLPTLVLAGIALSVIGPVGAVAVAAAHFHYRMRIVSPIGTWNFLNLAAKDGILIKDARTLDLLSQVDTIVFDKTGTLTTEELHLERIYRYDPRYEETTLLTYTAAAEHRQAHPIAKAIRDAAVARQLSLPRVDEAEYKVGYGLVVTLDATVVHVGSMRFMDLVGIPVAPQQRATWRSCHEQGHSLVMIAIDEQLAGAIELRQTIRPEAQAIMRQLRQQTHIQSIYVISGDHDLPTQRLSESLGIDHYVANMLPEEKAALIGQLQKEGHVVCYVGDGINDAIALKKSHVSIALRGISTVASDAAQVILMDESLNQLIKLFNISKDFTYSINIIFAAIIIPTIISTAGIFFWGFGLVNVFLLKWIGYLIAIATAMAPVLQRETE